ncbi:MAG: HAD-IB family phosphatase [Candidatus Bathyarchaeia archaeon]
MDSSKAVVMSDFDETIVTIDTAEFALQLFADPSWKRIEEQFEAGEISFEESLQREFAMIKAPEKVILDELDKVAALRPNFERLIEYCKRQRLPLIIVSGGLEFCIRHFLGRGDWLNFMEIYAPKSQFTGKGYEVTMPRLFGKGSFNFKDDFVRHHKEQGNRVFYIGDGLGDFPAAREADFSFAIKGSKLAEACRKGNVPHREIADFQEVIDAIDDLKG